MSRDEARSIFAKASQSIIRRRCDATTVANVRCGLQLIAEDRALRASIFRHPLGFVRIPLHAMFELPHIPYIHLWSEVHRGSTRERIHYHNIDLTSFVMVGSLADLRFDAVDAEPHTHGFYRVEFGDFGSRRVREPRSCSVSERSSQKVSAGMVYDIPALHFHNTVIDENDWPITFVVTSNQLEVPDVALGELSGPAIESFGHGSNLEDAEIVPLLSAAIARLESGLNPDPRDRIGALAGA